MVGGIVIIQIELAMQPENGGGVARDMSAMTAGFVMPGMLNGYLLDTPVFGREFDILALHALQNDLAFGFQFQQTVVHVVSRRNGRVTDDGMRFSFEDLLNGG